MRVRKPEDELTPRPRRVRRRRVDDKTGSQNSLMNRINRYSDIEAERHR
jgi:hypothetical protein